MRLGLVTWNPLAKLAVASGLYPAPMLLGYWGMMSSRVLMAAVELGVFDTLAARTMSAEEVARDIGCDTVGTEALLNALNGFGYLKRRGGLYRNGRAVRRWLQSDARFPLTGAFGLFRVLWDELDDVEDRLRSARERDFHADRNDHFWQRYQTGLAQFARLGSAEIVRKIRLDDEPKRLLDVGGGHATYSARFCRRYPSLCAEVIDLPGAVKIGRDLVSETGLQDRITFREGDLLAEPWGEGHDVVLLFNVIHIFTPHQVVELFAKAKRALKPGGTFVVLDSAHTGRNGNIDSAGGANELLFWVINNTRAYPEEDVARWMRDAAFTNVRGRHLTVVPQAALTTGRA
ncbi:MAG: methyltransferase [Coriobacteriia bacterium]|nr:methyltransferase [Coriobacteriia bacterium]